MALFRGIVFASALSGLVAGLLITAIQAFTTVPLILEAETYETNASASGNPVAEAPAGHHHDQTSSGHSHDAEAWAPAEGVQRTVSTALANVLTGISYALLLCAAFVVRGRDMNWRLGMYWGLAGFAAFTLAPGLGLPPELPGIEAAPLMERQVWWLATVALTAGGLALIFLADKKLFAIAGAAMIVLPHVIGAPVATVHGGHVPENLLHEFRVASVLTSFVFWLVLGMLSGMFYRRFVGDARNGVATQPA
jgi:cobalt transporter subunit CbtA